MTMQALQPNAASVQPIGMSQVFNAQGAVETTKTSEYVPFKVKYDLGEYRMFCHFTSSMFAFLTEF